MNLDDFAKFEVVDTRNMLGEIDGLPRQLQLAWVSGQQQPLPDWQNISQVVVAGMGASAIGADLLAAYCAPRSSMPVWIHRDYGLPAWANGPHTLVIASSHSGDTEETLDAFHQASTHQCQVLSITTGGKLADLTRQAGLPLWQFTHAGQPRAAVGFSFGLLLSAFTRLGFISDPATELAAAVQTMQNQQDTLRAEVPIVQNPAKRLAGQLIGRWITVIGSGILTPVARRWKGQISELAQAWAQFEFIPEADHNSLAGTVNPAGPLSQMIALFLRAPSDHPRNRLRIDLTRQAFMLEGINSDIYDAAGDGPLAHMWTALHFGDYLAYYLAMAYDADPTPVAALVNFKNELSSRKL